MLNTLSKNKQTKKYKETFVRVKSLITIFTAADDSMGRALDGCFRDTTVLCYDGATLNKFVASKAHWVVLLICHHAWKVKSPQNSTFFFKMCLAIFQVIMSRANQRECARRLLVGTNMLLPSRTWHFVWCSVKFTGKVNALVNAYFSWYCREDTEKIHGISNGRVHLGRAIIKCVGLSIGNLHRAATTQLVDTAYVASDCHENTRCLTQTCSPHLLSQILNKKPGNLPFEIRGSGVIGTDNRNVILLGTYRRHRPMTQEERSRTNQPLGC